MEINSHMYTYGRLPNNDLVGGVQSFFVNGFCEVWQKWVEVWTIAPKDFFFMCEVKDHFTYN